MTIHMRPAGMGCQYHSQKCQKCWACWGGFERDPQGTGGLVTNVQTQFKLFWPFCTNFYIMCTEFWVMRLGLKYQKNRKKIQPTAFQSPSVLHPIRITQNPWKLIHFKWWGTRLWLWWFDRSNGSGMYIGLKSFLNWGHVLNLGQPDL